MGPIRRGAESLGESGPACPCDLRPACQQSETLAAIAGKRATAERDAADPMKPPYTPRQGQFLAYINHYITLHGRPPAEVEMMQFFQVTPPSVHQMIITLERRKLISRVPGQARSITLRLPAEELPPLQGTTATATIHP